MVKGVRLSLNKQVVLALALIATATLTGCSRSAPSLPASDGTTGVVPKHQILETERLEKCKMMDSRLLKIDREVASVESQIKAKRGQNQVAGYFGALFLVPLLAVDDQSEEKVHLDHLQFERDEIYQKKRQLTCPGG